MRNARQEIPVSIDAPLLLVHLRARWRVVALSCAVAALAALIVSLLLPSRYTATCRILMDPPAGTDPRVSTAVSPIYLESLRTYELFASSDDLFLQAAQKFGLRDNNSTPIERLKKKILNVEVLRNTKILEINATLRDPRRAHELALYLGQAAVKLNRAAAQSSDSELRADAEQQLAEARQAWERSLQDWAAAVHAGPVDQANAELEADVKVRSRLEREFAYAQVDLAEAQAASPARPQDIKVTRARVDQLQSEIKSVDASIAREQSLIAERSTRIAKLESAAKAAEAVLRTAEAHLHDVRIAAGYRGERLSIIDPGIVPERPSSPNIPLNVIAAAFAALVLSLLYLLLEIGYRRPAAYD